MNAWTLIALFLIVPLAAAAPEYAYTLNERGIVDLELTTDIEVLIELPQDAENYESSTALLTRNSNRIRLVPDGVGTLRFATAYYTSKEKGIWTLHAPIPQQGTVTVTLPNGVVIARTSPQGTIATGDHPTITFTNATEDIQVSYTLPPPAMQAGNPSTIHTGTIAGVALMLALAGATFLFASRRRRESSTPQGELTTRQKDVLHAASPNEQIVLTHLLTANGIIKRNKLERASGLAKSSLASTLHSLEQKDLIRIDRTFRVHVIHATDWLAQAQDDKNPS